MQGIEIQKLMLEKGMKKKEMAARCGWSQNSFGNKLKRDNFTERDLRKMYDALGYDLEIRYIPKEQEEL